MFCIITLIHFNFVIEIFSYGVERMKISYLDDFSMNILCTDICDACRYRTFTHSQSIILTRWVGKAAVHRQNYAKQFSAIAISLHRLFTPLLLSTFVTCGSCYTVLKEMISSFIYTTS